jgi:hypothetical protein
MLGLTLTGTVNTKRSSSKLAHFIHRIKRRTSRFSYKSPVTKRKRNEGDHSTLQKAQGAGLQGLLSERRFPLLACWTIIPRQISLYGVMWSPLPQTSQSKAWWHRSCVIGCRIRSLALSGRVKGSTSTPSFLAAFF